MLLKACLAPPPHGHDLGLLLAALAARLRREHGADLPVIAQARIAEFVCFDPGGIAFRYSQAPPTPRRGFGPIPSEAHVELQHLRRTMLPITQGLAELAQGLQAGDQRAVLLALTTMANTGSAG